MDEKSTQVVRKAFRWPLRLFIAVAVGAALFALLTWLRVESVYLKILFVPIALLGVAFVASVFYEVAKIYMGMFKRVRRP